MPNRVDEVRLRTERVRETKESEEVSAGVEGVDGVELFVTVNEGGRKGVGRKILGLSVILTIGSVKICL